MATLAEVNAFIEKLSKLAIAERKKRDKWVLPSICIAQAALETGWGKSNLMVKANAYFGIKASKSWVGKVYDSKTSECYDGVNYVNITATFRAYDNVEESVADYFDLITKSSRYAGAVNNADALSAITAIKNGGYATSPTYIEKIMKIVNTYNLTQYDKVEETQATAKPTTSTTVSATVSATVSNIKVGDVVNINNGSKYYNSTKAVPSWVIKESWYVISVNGNRIVLGKSFDGKNTLNSALNISDLKVVTTTANTATPATTTATPKVSYYPKYMGTTVSITTALKSIGVDSSFSNRRKIAVANGIVKSSALYLGTSAQNSTMLKLLKKGELIKI